MKRLEGLNDKLSLIETGSSIPLAQEPPPSFKELYRLVLQVGRAAGPENAIDRLDLNVALKEAGDSLDMTEAQHKVLKDAVVANPTGLVDYFWAQLLKKLG